MKAVRRLKRIQFVVGLSLTILLLCYMKTLYSDQHTDLNASYLLSPSDSPVVLELNFNKSKEELESEIRTMVPSNDLKSPVKFGLKVNGKIYNSSIHAPHINQFACYGMPAMRHKSPQLEVLMNNEHKLMIEGLHRLEIDSLANFISWYFPNDAPYGEKVVKLQCDEACTDLKIKECIEAIGDGYLNYYRKESKRKFQKPIYELDSAELNLVSKKYPFELRLWIGDPASIPVPPVIKPASFSGINL